MIQSILFFALGFLCAGFLALMIAPAVWRRAVRMTRRRIEASVPLSMSDIQADKDRMRAEFAMSTRRLEMSFKAFREKAAAQIIEVSRSREELKGLSAEHGLKNQAITELEGKSAELRAELLKREEQLAQMSEKLAAAERSVGERAFELDKLSRLYDDASFSSSSRQIELVARESELERINADQQEAERRYKDVLAESQATREALTVERKRSLDLEKRLESLLSTLTERESNLDSSEKELARLRTQMNSVALTESELNTQLLKAQQDKLKAEAEHADLSMQMTNLLSNAKGSDDKALATLTANRDLLESRLTSMTRENRRLKDEIAVLERSKSEDWTDDRRNGALLRERMNDLAAEVVKLTAMLDGPDGAINKALAASPPQGAPANDAGKVTSLADRVRALQQKAAAAG